MGGSGPESVMPRIGTHRRRCLFLALLLSAFVGRRAEAGEPVRVPGTGVRLAPPDGFVATERFPGFRSEDGAATIQVTEMPGPYAEVKGALATEALAKRGMMLLSVADATVNGAPGVLARVSQAFEGTWYLKWMVLGGDASGTVLLVGTFPEAAAARFEAPIRAALLGATWTPHAARDVFEGLPFRLVATERLKVAGRMANAVLLNETGKVPSASPEEALLVVGLSHSAVPQADLVAFSKRRALATESLAGVTDLEGTSTKVAGLEAYELVARAKDAKSGEARHLYQVIALDGTGYWLVQGIVPSSRAEGMIAEFRTVVASLRKAPAASEAGAKPPASPSPVPPAPKGGG